MAVGPKKEAETPEAAAPATSASSERKKRSKSFPTLPLPDAIEVIEIAGSHGMEHSLSAFAKYAGHQTTNSGPFKQKLASFRDWKLISVNDDKVTIPDSSRPLVLKSDPDAVTVATRSAFLGCEIMRNFYEAMAKGVPYDVAALKKHAVVDFEVSSEASENFAKSVARSAIAAGLAEPTDEEGGIKFISAQNPSPASEPDEDDSERHQGDSTKMDTYQRRPYRDDLGEATDAPIVVRQLWETKSGSVTFEIRSREPLAAAAFAEVGAVVKEASDLAATLGPREEAAIDAT